MTTDPGPAKLPWYKTAETAVIGLVLVGPLALPLVWFCPKFSRRAKIWMTLATIVLTVVLLKVTAVSLSVLRDQLSKLKADI